MITQRRTRLAAVYTVIAAMLAIAVAPLWHHHDHHLPTPSSSPHLAHLAHSDRGHHHHDHGSCPSHRSSKHPGADHDHAAPAGGHAPDHHHHDDHDHEHDCPICVAISAPLGSGLPPHTPRLGLDQRPTGFVPTLIAQRPVVRFLPVLWPCGPPAIGL